MTTAHRPTFNAAKGGEEQGGNRYYFKSNFRGRAAQTGHTQLKFRQTGQAARNELLDRDLRSELQAKEDGKKGGMEQRDFEEEKKRDLALLMGSGGAVVGGGGGGGGGAAARAESGSLAERGPGSGGIAQTTATNHLAASRPLIPHAADADDEDDAASGSDSDTQNGSDGDDDDDSDDEAALMAELDRIKKERAEEEARRAAEVAKREEEAKRLEAVAGNPLRSLVDPDSSGGGGGGGGMLKRRWDDDVVFKNQAKSEPKQQKRFINDTVRSDFHRRFMDRYIR